jgi:hypothetical protein
MQQTFVNTIINMIRTYCDLLRRKTFVQVALRCKSPCAGRAARFPSCAVAMKAQPSRPVLILKTTTTTPLREPTVDAGFVSWLDLEIHITHEGESAGVAGNARVALIHVGEAMNYGEALYDVLDADSAELEALYNVSLTAHRSTRNTRTASDPRCSTSHTSRLHRRGPGAESRKRWRNV